MMYRRIQSNILMKSELENILRSIWTAHNGLAGALQERDVQIYRAGFHAALQAVGLGVGVEWEDLPPYTIDQVKISAQFDQGILK